MAKHPIIALRANLISPMDHTDQTPQRRIMTIKALGVFALLLTLMLSAGNAVAVVDESFEAYTSGTSANVAAPSRFSPVDALPIGVIVNGVSTANVPTSKVLQQFTATGTAATRIAGADLVGDVEISLDFLVAGGTHNIWLRDSTLNIDAVLIRLIDAGSGAPGKFYLQVQGNTGSSPPVFEALVDQGDWVRGTITLHIDANPALSSFSVSFVNLTDDTAINPQTGNGVSGGMFAGNPVAKVNQAQAESTGGVLQIDNIAVQNNSINIASATYGAIPLASSQISNVNQQAEKVIDNNAGTAWASTTGTFPNWMELRWHQPFDLHAVIISESVSQACSSYRIDAYRVDTNTWETVVGPKANASPGQPISESLNTPGVLKVRFYALTPHNGAPRSGMHTIEVYGSAEWIEAVEAGLPPYQPDSGLFPAQHANALFSRTSFSANPTDPEPGQTVQVSVQLRKTTNDTRDYGFQFRIGRMGDGDGYGGVDYTAAVTEVKPAIPTSQWVTGQDYTITADIYLPEWAPHDNLPVVVTPLRAASGAPSFTPASSGRIVNVTDNIVGTVDVRRFATDPTPWPAVVPTTTVRVENDQANLYVNGKYVPPYIMTVPDYASYQAMGGQATPETHLWRVLVLKDVAADYNTPAGDAENAQYFAGINQEINNLLKIDPDAYIIVTFLMRPTIWSLNWPNETTVLSDGTRHSYSLSSPRWAAQVDYDYRALTAHLMTQPYAGHVIGVQYEVSKETQYWGWEVLTNTVNTPRADIVLGDFSPVHIAAFRQWLQEKYVTEAALKDAWNDPAVTFANAYPTPSVLRQMDPTLMFKDPAVTAMPMDYWQFHGEAMAKMAEVAAKAVKEASGGKYLTGMWGFYSTGTFTTGTRPGTLVHCGYTAYQKAMQSPYIDSLSMIQAYTHRLGGRPMLTESLPRSIIRHGKMPLIEFDVRTFFVPLEVASNTFSEQESIAAMYSYAWGAGLQGTALWWVGFPAGAVGSSRNSIPWFTTDSINQVIFKAKRWFDAIRATPSPSISEVAVFFNNADIWGIDPYDGYKALVSAQYQTAFFELMRVGAPVDYYELDDIYLPGMDQYKVYVFLNAHNLSTAQRDQIKSMVRQAGKTAVWVYGSGFSDGSANSVANIQDLTGMVTEVTLERRLPTVNFLPGHALTANIPVGYTMQPRRWEHDPNPYSIGPIFNVNDPSAEPLGTYAHNGKVAYATKMVGGGRSVYMAIPYMSSVVLRDICRQAGVFLYNEANVYLDADKHFVIVSNSDVPINTTIKLPYTSHIYDLWNDTVIGVSNSFTANIPAKESRMYFYGSSTELAAFQAAILEAGPEPPSLAGDLNGDGFVGIADLNIVLGRWNQTVPVGDKSQGDPSCDGYVGISDLNIVLGNWNAGTPPGAGSR